MKFSDIAGIRLCNQQIAGTRITAIKDIVGWMGAMQAQDYAMAKWAIGVRLSNSTDQSIEAAIDNAEILRTHILRPTWHLVSADDIYWMLELTAPQIKTKLKSRHKELEISASIITKSNKVIEHVLRDCDQLTRDELLAVLEKAGLVTDGNRAYHLLVFAELEGILCSGAIIDRKQTYALLEKRIPKKNPLTLDESLARLAKQYFVSRGPATVQDFAWWSGLSISHAMHALEIVKSDFISETIDSQTCWFTNSSSLPGTNKEDVHLLPAFDEFIISYKDRSVSLHNENFNKAVSSNGIFRPVIVVNGQVVGIWKRTIKKDKAIVEMDFFQPPDKSIKSQIEIALKQYGRFLAKKTEIISKF